MPDEHGSVQVSQNAGASTCGLQAIHDYPTRVHPTAEVSTGAEIGAGCSIWHQAQVREGARLGRNCIVGKGAYIDFDVCIGDNVKIQNGASIYHGATLENGVFVGPYACLTNDKVPRAVNPDGSLKGAEDWTVSPVRVRDGAALGAHSVVLPGVTIGRWAMVGSGAVVTRDVPDYGLVWGNPARLRGFVCPCGHRLEADRVASASALGSAQGWAPTPAGAPNGILARCTKCGREIEIERSAWEAVVD